MQFSHKFIHQFENQEITESPFKCISTQDHCSITSLPFLQAFTPVVLRLPANLKLVLLPICPVPLNPYQYFRYTLVGSALFLMPWSRPVWFIIIIIIIYSLTLFYQQWISCPQFSWFCEFLYQLKTMSRIMTRKRRDAVIFLLN